MTVPRSEPMTSTGSQFITPPSTWASPAIITGGSKPGMQALACNACVKLPFRCTAKVSCREIRRDAEIRSPKVLDSNGAELLLQKADHFFTPREGKKREGIVVNRVRLGERVPQSLLDLSIVDSSAMAAPMIAPMLQPPIKSIGIFASRSALTTPRCANPRAPPELSTRPTAEPCSNLASRATSSALLRRMWQMTSRRKRSCQRSMARPQLAPVSCSKRGQGDAAIG